MHFSLVKIGKPAAAAALLSLASVGTYVVGAQTATEQPQTQQTQPQQPGQQPAQGAQPGQQPAQGQAGAAGQAGQGQKNYKDRAEYELYDSITKESDPQKKLDLLKQWDQKYPTSDFKQDRTNLMVATAQAAAQSGKLQVAVDAASEALKADPQNFGALYYSMIYIPALAGNNPANPDQISQAENAAHGVLNGLDTQFVPAKKPANMSDADWTKAKGQAGAAAHNTLAWAALQKRDQATAENEYQASLQANPENGQIAYQLGQILMQQKKYQDALFYIARAAVYDGPNAINPNSRQQVLAYFQRAYKDFHGSPEGADQVLNAAKTSAVPPPNFKIVSVQDVANQQATQMNQRMQSDPGFALWESIKASLTSPNGDSFFTNNVKGAEIPGGANGVKAFTGTVISADPPTRPTRIVLAVEDPTKADATLEFEEPITAAIAPGEKLEFTGVGSSFTKEPYMLNFKEVDIPGKNVHRPAGGARRPVRRGR